MYVVLQKTNTSTSKTCQKKQLRGGNTQKKKTSDSEYLRPNQPNMFLDTAQRMEQDEDEMLQGKFAVQREAAPNLTGMPDNLKAGVESLSGFSMDSVRVHYNSTKPATVQALAYTQGTDIHVASGQEQHLPHEAWHVAQQMAGRVQPTTEIGGMPVNDNAALEHEADVMGARALAK